MKYFHVQVDGHSHSVSALNVTSHEYAWNYSLTTLRPGDYVFQLWDDSKEHRVLYHTRRGTEICDEALYMPALGCVVAYCDTDGDVVLRDPVSAVAG